MSKRLVLIDSSIWVSYLSRQPLAPARDVQELLQSHRAAVNPIIRIEVLTGARDEAQYAALDDALRGLHQLPLSEAVVQRAERLRFELRRQGHLIPVPDILIASSALIYNCDLLHADQHFTFIAHAIPLKCYRAAR